ncbi:MAG: chromosome segregation protein SMC [Nitrospirota bacterium]
MQLKTLEMIGFKSFSDKTTITFQPGVTAVVGPNGCGKSNISDAIRWVLGEQSAKHIRGDKMEDVIFNGSESRKPLGMAEVTLRLTNISGLLSEFGQYSEIEITRRLYRSGESEYLINKIPCRLKDIRDLMMDAGVGAKAHAIIEQGRVDQILSSKPQDRRFLFEEVAGVMKYKARRQEAFSKLESTQQNQLRINDIITEVKRQVNSLDRQAKKAERYQKLRGEMKDLDFRLASVEYANLGREWATINEEFKNAEDEVTVHHANLSKIESSIEESRADALAAEQELTILQNRIHEIESELGRAEHRVEISKSQIASLQEQQNRDTADQEYLAQETAHIREQKASQEQELQMLFVSIREQETLLEQKTAVMDSLSNQLKEKETSLEQTRAGIFHAINESAAERTKISNLESRLVQIKEQDNRDLREKQELARKLSELQSRLAIQEQERADIAKQRTAAIDERATVSSRLEETIAKKKALETSLADVRNLLAGQRSRLRSLLELEQKLEGYQKGVKTVMSVQKETAAQERVGTIHGLVADMIETEPQYELAIEAVLGDRLQYVVVDSQRDSLKAINYLKTEKGGRSTFVPRSPREIKTEPFVKNGHDGVIGPALTLVRCKDHCSNVAQYLLGDVVIVDTIDTAVALWQKNGMHKTIVTLAGEIVDPWGAVTGGTVEAGGSGLLTKRREIKDLEQEVGQLETKTATLEAESALLETAIETDKIRETTLSDQIHALEIEGVNKDKDCSAIRDEIARTEERTAILEKESIERIKIIEELHAEMKVATEALSRLETGHASAQATVEAMQNDLAQHREKIESARAKITEIRMALTVLQEKQGATRQACERLSKSEVEMTERRQKREMELAAIAAKLIELESVITESEIRIKEHITVLEAERGIYITKQEAHAERTKALSAAEELVRAIMHDIESCQKRVSASEVKRTELRMSIEHLKDRIWSTYHADLDAVVRELGEFEIAVDEAKRRLEELREKIDQMGPINTDALQEYNELKERYDLLSTQQNDINESIANLKATIAKLDGETKELFTEAYNAIQEKFKEVFSLLFEGGKAELVLLDESDILESGIEIIAQPRGKKFQAISLLSGGERALTAIALLFAAFLVKPSPFCMLDEVDAPLDEANVTRFTRLIREMSTRSQFITITHNKRTMEMADALYGITMEEPGCSKVVSVKLREEALVE